MSRAMNKLLGVVRILLLNYLISASYSVALLKELKFQIKKK